MELVTAIERVWAGGDPQPLDALVLQQTGDELAKVASVVASAPCAPEQVS